MGSLFVVLSLIKSLSLGSGFLKGGGGGGDGCLFRTVLT